jgi:hypothetical protein
MPALFEPAVEPWLLKMHSDSGELDAGSVDTDGQRSYVLSWWAGSLGLDVQSRTCI